MKKAPRDRRNAPTNPSARVDLVRRAKDLRLNLSEVLETALEQTIRERERNAWLVQNREAITEYNRWVGERGVFSDDWRF